MIVVPVFVPLGPLELVVQAVVLVSWIVKMVVEVVKVGFEIGEQMHEMVSQVRLRLELSILIVAIGDVVIVDLVVCDPIAVIPSVFVVIFAPSAVVVATVVEFAKAAFVAIAKKIGFVVELAFVVLQSLRWCLLKPHLLFHRNRGALEILAPAAPAPFVHFQCRLARDLANLVLLFVVVFGEVVQRDLTEPVSTERIGVEVDSFRIPSARERHQRK